MPPPPSQKCSVPGCPYVTPDNIPTWEILTTHLHAHTQAVHMQLAAPKESNVLFSFRHSNYDNMLGRNIASTVKYPELKKRSEIDFNDFHIICSEDHDHRVVVISKFLLVLLHPFYQNILHDDDVTALVLPEVTVRQLAHDFFGVLTSFCAEFSDDVAAETIKSEPIYSVFVDADEADVSSSFTSFERSVQEFENREKQQFEQRLNRTMPTVKDSTERFEEVAVSQPVRQDDQCNSRTRFYPPHVKTEKCDVISKLDIFSDGEQVTCPVCNAEFDSQSTPRNCACGYLLNPIYNPLCEVVPLPAPKRGQSICPKCRRKYNNRAKPKICECGHFIGGSFDPNTHEKKVLKCPECDYQVVGTKSKNNLKTHIDAIHRNVTYSCTFCNYKSGYKQALQKHIQSQHKGAVYQCKECDFTNKYESGLSQHVKVVHRGFRYICQYCGHQAKGSSELRKHEIARHKEEILIRGDDRRRYVYRSKSKTVRQECTEVT